MLSTISKKKELLSEITQTSKKYIIASSPDEILAILRARKRKIEEQEREFLRVISVLQSKYQAPNENEVKIYNTSQSEKLLLNDLSTTSCDDILVIFLPFGNISKKKLDSVYKKIRKHSAKIKIREIYINQNINQKEKAPSLNYVHEKSVRVKSKLPEGTVVLADKIIIFGKSKNFSLEQKEMVQFLKSICQIAWKI